jgi:hypothetical protein
VGATLHYPLPNRQFQGFKREAEAIKYERRVSLSKGPIEKMDSAAGCWPCAGVASCPLEYRSPLSAGSSEIAVKGHWT